MSYELFIEDEDGELVDALPVCSRGCARDVARIEGLEGDNALPLSYEPELDTWCLGCGVIMGGYADPEGNEDCRHRYPVVVNRFLIDTPEVCEHGVTVQQPIALTVWAEEFARQDEDATEYIEERITTGLEDDTL